MSHRRAGAIVALLLTASSCASSGTSKDGSDALIVYSGREESLVGELIRNFSEATGIDVQVKYGETSELAATIAEEGDASPADVFWAQDGGALGAIEAEGLLAALPETLTEQVDARYRSPSGSWVGTSARIRVIAYSTARVETADAPDTIDGLTDPRWKGKVGWAPTNGSFQAFVTALRLVDGEERARAWLEAMIENGAVSYAKNSVTALAINDGEIDLGLINHYYPLELAVDDPDLAVSSIFPRDIGALANVAGVGILASSTRTENAERFVEYLLSEDAQRYFVERTFEYPLIDGIPADGRLPALNTLKLPDVPLSSLTDLEGTLEMLSEVGLL